MKLYFNDCGSVMHLWPSSRVWRGLGPELAGRQSDGTATPLAHSHTSNRLSPAAHQTLLSTPRGSETDTSSSPWGPWEVEDRRERLSVDDRTHYLNRADLLPALPLLPFSYLSSSMHHSPPLPPPPPTRSNLSALLSLFLPRNDEISLFVKKLTPSKDLWKKKRHTYLFNINPQLWQRRARHPLIEIMYLSSYLPEENDKFKLSAEQQWVNPLHRQSLMFLLTAVPLISSMKHRYIIICSSAQHCSWCIFIYLFFFLWGNIKVLKTAPNKVSWHFDWLKRSD